jgi:hypothetical protein
MMRDACIAYDAMRVMRVMHMRGMRVMSAMLEWRVVARVWVCGCVGVWVCGCVGVWVCGCVVCGVLLRLYLRKM